jgi:hypothetical protein
MEETRLGPCFLLFHRLRNEHKRWPLTWCVPHLRPDCTAVAYYLSFPAAAAAAAAAAVATPTPYSPACLLVLGPPIDVCAPICRYLSQEQERARFMAAGKSAVAASLHVPDDVADVVYRMWAQERALLSVEDKSGMKIRSASDASRSYPWPELSHAEIHAQLSSPSYGTHSRDSASSPTSSRHRHGSNDRRRSPAPDAGTNNWSAAQDDESEGDRRQRRSGSTEEDVHRSHTHRSREADAYDGTGSHNRSRSHSRERSSSPHRHSRHSHRDGDGHGSSHTRSHSRSRGNSSSRSSARPRDGSDHGSDLATMGVEEEEQVEQLYQQRQPPHPHHHRPPHVPNAASTAAATTSLHAYHDDDNLMYSDSAMPVTQRSIKLSHTPLPTVRPPVAPSAPTQASAPPPRPPAPAPAQAPSPSLVVSAQAPQGTSDWWPSADAVAPILVTTPLAPSTATPRPASSSDSTRPASSTASPSSAYTAEHPSARTSGPVSPSYVPQPVAGPLGSPVLPLFVMNLKVRLANKPMVFVVTKHADPAVSDYVLSWTSLSPELKQVCLSVCLSVCVSVFLHVLNAVCCLFTVLHECRTASFSCRTLTPSRPSEATSSLGSARPNCEKLLTPRVVSCSLR